MLADKKSPIAYGYDRDELAVYFSQAPVHQRSAPAAAPAAASAAAAAAPQIPGVGQNMTPNAVPETLADAGRPAAPTAAAGAAAAPADEAAQVVQVARRAASMWTRRAAARDPALPAPIPNDMLLSGGLVGRQALAGRAVVVDAPSARATS